MICLGLDADRNRLCFCVRDGDRLCYYRYTTLIFRFISRPFELGSMLKLHTVRYSLDACRTMMQSRFYVDNLVMTDSDPTKLAGLNSLVRERLQKGGFVIQSCNTNCDNFRNEMSTNDTQSTDGDEWKRVLGRDIIHSRKSQSDVILTRRLRGRSF